MLRWLRILLIGLTSVDSYKILVYNSAFAHSHSNFMGRIADILVEAGHNVTTLVSVMDPEVAYGTKLSKVIKVPASEATTNMYSQITKTQADFFGDNSFDPIGAYHRGQFYSSLIATQCRAVLDEPGLVEKLTAETYDVYFAEHFDMCGIALSELIKPISIISVASTIAFGPQLEEFGIPATLSYDPCLYVSKLDVHSMWDRLMNIFGDFVVRTSYTQLRSAIHALFKEKFGSNFPSMAQIASHSAYVFTNTEPLIDFAVPTISKVIPIGGLGSKEPEKLSEDWEKILAKRPKTVLLSFGTISLAVDLPFEVKKSIVDTVKALPNVTFIWKYEKDDDFTRDYASKIENLELTKWMPQFDLLSHGNLSAFITHGGMGSTYDIALSGVPGIFIPLTGDQPRNSGMMEHNGFGKVFDKNDITDPAKLVAVIRHVLENESYRSNARRISAMLHKRPFTAKEKLIKHTEFAAEFGPSKALKPQSHDMNWIEYHNADIIIAGTGIALGVAVITLMIAKRIIRRIMHLLRSQ